MIPINEGVAPEVAAEPSTLPDSPFPLSTVARVVLAMLSIGSAVIHLVMFPPHIGESAVLGLSFAATGWFQLAFAVVVIVRPSRAWLWIGLVANIGFVVVWAASRTTGLPFGLEGGQPEAATAVDLTCAALEAVLVVACGAFLRKPTAGENLARPTVVAVSAVPCVVVVMATGALASPTARNHDHGSGGHGSGENASGVEAADHAHGSGHTTDHANHPTDHATKPAMGDEHGGEGGHEHGHEAAVASNKPWSLGATEAEISDTEAFITRTQAAVATFTSVADAESKGYVRINGDHLLSPQLLLDNKLLDSTAIESLIVGQRNGEDFIAGGMYLMNLGQTMKDVPRLGGPLLMWHSHGGFCFDQNVKIVGVDPATNKCPSDAKWFDDPPMTHIWSNPQPNPDGVMRTPESCGVFAYLDLPHGRPVPGCSKDGGTGQAHG